MKRKLTTTLIILITEIAFSQIKATVIDSITNEKISFVNIWVENENNGTTSDEKGEFLLNPNDINKPIMFSAIGYVTKKVYAKSIDKKVELKPKITALEEVIISSKKEKEEELVIGTFKKGKINTYFGCQKKPWIAARYFNYNSNYDKTPYLKKIKLLTRGEIDSKFNIRLYSVNNNGEPNNYIYDENIIGLAEKGKKITEIDVSKLNIKFPEKGFFIAVEWLIIDSNKYEYTCTSTESKKEFIATSYEPMIGTIPAETDENSWIYDRGKWTRPFGKNKGGSKQYEDKYLLLAVELTLMN